MTAVALSRLAATSTDDGQRKTAFQLENPMRSYYTVSHKNVPSNICPYLPKIAGGWGFVPDPTGGAYSAPPNALDGFKGNRKGRKGIGRGMKKRRKRNGRERKERREAKRGEERERKEGLSPPPIPGSATAQTPNRSEK